MARREKDVELVASGCERERVRPFFGCDASELLHGLRVEDVDDAWIANGDVEAIAYAIEEHDIWRATQGTLAQDLPRTGIESDQQSRVAGTEEAMCADVEIEAMRPG